ncbi:hypothetical protein HZH68_014411 [Vespula germanica]|uniref:Uncharacterized protein n=1 Tax=Vespula germanica TaxID=30212 RepID=A0A834MV43_VESGE|nr:hypothetical protein HZH68_014411 [Vespula germanica]
MGSCSRKSVKSHGCARRWRKSLQNRERSDPLKAVLYAASDVCANPKDYELVSLNHSLAGAGTVSARLLLDEERRDVSRRRNSLGEVRFEFAS